MSIRAGATPVLLGVRGDQVRGNAGVGVAGQGSINPLSVPSLNGWFDFSDLSTVFQDTAFATPVTADAQLIGSMRDKSGNGRDLVRGGAGGTEPVYKAAIQNGKSVGRFDTARWLLSGATFPGAQTQQTVICVAVNGGGSTLMAPWACTSSSNDRLSSSWNNGSNLAGMLVGTGAGSYTEAWNSATVGWIVVSCVVNNAGAVSQVYGNGVLQSSGSGVPAILTSTLFTIGSRQTSLLTSGFNGDIGEVLVYGTALPANQRAGLENNLRAKWATA